MASRERKSECAATPHDQYPLQPPHCRRARLPRREFDFLALAGVGGAPSFAGGLRARCRLRRGAAAPQRAGGRSSLDAEVLLDGRSDGRHGGLAALGVLSVEPSLVAAPERRLRVPVPDANGHAALRRDGGHAAGGRVARHDGRNGCVALLQAAVSARVVRHAVGAGGRRRSGGGSHPRRAGRPSGRRAWQQRGPRTKTRSSRRFQLCVLGLHLWLKPWPEPRTQH